MTDLKFATRQLLKNPGFTAVAVALSWAMHVDACTIFVLTDGARTLFFNNEDYSNPTTWLWFIPAGEGHLGCAYVGYDDGWAQGGFNTAGLAFDWVAGFADAWKPGANLKPVRGNPAQRMLESCATAEEAVAFFQHHREPSFSSARILIADRTGASVIIGARDNKLTVDRSSRSRGFGYGGQTLAKMLKDSPAPLTARGLSILRACKQIGENATKYSNVYDLRSGEIKIVPPNKAGETVNFGLATELAKGAHYYDIPELDERVEPPGHPLRNEMKRFYLDEFPPINDPDPKATKQIQRILLDSINGAMHADDYAPEFWSALAPQQKNVQAELKRLGDFESLTLVRRKEAGTDRELLYRVDFGKITVLQRFVLNAEGKVKKIQSEGSELKSGAGLANR